MSKRLLLVNPANGSSFWGLEYAAKLAAARYSNAPLPLLTVAALTPETWDIKLVDENVDTLDLDEPCDVVGITAMNTQALRAYELAAEFKKRGRHVVIGGPFATLEPERAAPHADTVVVGEAEYTWPRFCQEFERGEHSDRYVETGVVDLADSPIPRYDLVKPGTYGTMPVQTTRGCPFSCEFCDIIVMQGRKVRSKPIEHVLAEIEASRVAKSPAIFFTDDNFIGAPKYARPLLDGIIEQRERTGFRPLLFSQASVNLAEQDEVLDRMIGAGFTRIFLGIETPREASLLETGKRQNVRGNLVERIHKIQAAGLMIWAGMIVGFDQDDERIFEEQANFLDEAGISVAMVGILNAPPKTPLYQRLSAEGRIHSAESWTDNCAWTNIVPKQMSREALFRGYADLVSHLYEQDNYARRVVSNIQRMGPPRPGAKAGAVPGPVMMMRLMRALNTFCLTTDPVKRRHFVPNLWKTYKTHPKRIAEAAIHLGLWHHFEHYVPELVAALDVAARGEGLARAAK